MSGKAHIYFESIRRPSVGSPAAPSSQILRDGAAGCFSNSRLSPVRANAPGITYEPAAKADPPVLAGNELFPLLTKPGAPTPRHDAVSAGLKFSRLADAAFDIFALIVCALFVIMTALSFPLALFILLFL